VRPNYPPTMDLAYDAKTKLFDQMNQKIDIGELDCGANAMIYIEFDQIVITSNGFFRKWRIVQMKCLKNSIGLSENLFEENQNSGQSYNGQSYNGQSYNGQSYNGQSYNRPIPIPPPLTSYSAPVSPNNESIASSSSKANNNNFPQPMNEVKNDKPAPVEFVAPTKEELINMMSRLKKKAHTRINTSEKENNKKDVLSQIMNEIIKKKESMEIDRNNKLIQKYITECDSLCIDDINEMKIQINTFNDLCSSIENAIADERLSENNINESDIEEDIEEDPFSLPYEGVRRLD